MNEILKRIERDNEVNARWTASDTKFIRFRNSAVSKIRRRLFTQAEKENVERMFFSTLIKKYPSEYFQRAYCLRRTIEIIIICYLKFLLFWQLNFSTAGYVIQQTYSTRMRF